MKKVIKSLLLIYNSNINTFYVLDNLFLLILNIFQVISLKLVELATWSISENIFNKRDFFI